MLYRGTIILMLQIKKNKTKLEVRDLSVMCKCPGSIWVFCLSLHDCCQHRLKLTLCAQWMQDWPPLTLLKSEGQRAHILLSVWLNPQMRVCSEAKRRNVTDRKSMPQVEWAEILWMLILENGRQWRCAGCIQACQCFDTKEMICAIKLTEDQMIKLKTYFSW